ncbi:hypothetical protein VNO80_09423 [Phaseolus coccineus]|uniref:Uncharacterized protein n=1 Tax=Phaseolus coccineus TaxID=3886 RepID=A0AAN9N6S3_PHACN
MKMGMSTGIVGSVSEWLKEVSGRCKQQSHGFNDMSAWVFNWNWGLEFFKLKLGSTLQKKIRLLCQPIRKRESCDERIRAARWRLHGDVIRKREPKVFYSRASPQPVLINKLMFSSLSYTSFIALAHPPPTVEL